MRTTLGAFLETLAHYPDESQTLLVEIVGAGPRAMERRDRALEAVAQYLVELNEQDAERGATPRFARPTTRSRSSAPSSSSPRARSAPACPATSASSSRSSSASASG